MPFLEEELKRLGRLWGVPRLAQVASVHFSDRLRVTWGRAIHRNGRIHLHGALRRAPRARLSRVLCHEAAHLAVWLQHGDRATPHGPEWRALVERAGQRPELRLASPPMQKNPPRVATPKRHFEHRCPVCQAVRTARRRMPAWRCADCVRSNLDGTMLITEFK